MKNKTVHYGRFKILREKIGRNEMMEKFCTGTRGGWKKYEGNPVLGGKYGTCFDISVLEEGDTIKMYFSWRGEGSIAVTESRDGIHWGIPQICIKPRKTQQGWEDEVNRPIVVKRNGIYHMWYTGQYKPGQVDGNSYLFYATSKDGITFTRMSEEPVMFPDCEWEKVAVMCPHVLWNEEKQIYQMWYSGGEQYEPTAIGYAESGDGYCWKKYAGNPIFMADPSTAWEQHKAAGCQVIRWNKGYLMFYIGYHNEDYAQIGMAFSENGVTDWKRSELNPIIAPDPKQFDGEACYKPYVIHRNGKWFLWYNGRKEHLEQIGMAVYEGDEIIF